MFFCSLFLVRLSEKRLRRATRWTQSVRDSRRACCGRTAVAAEFSLAVPRAHHSTNAAVTVMFVVAGWSGSNTSRAKGSRLLFPTGSRTRSLDHRVNNTRVRHGTASRIVRIHCVCTVAFPSSVVPSTRQNWRSRYYPDLGSRSITITGPTSTTMFSKSSPESPSTITTARRRSSTTTCWPTGTRRTPTRLRTRTASKRTRCVRGAANPSRRALIGEAGGNRTNPPTKMVSTALRYNNILLCMWVSRFLRFLEGGDFYFCSPIDYYIPRPFYK